MKANELKLNNIVGRGFMNPAPTGLKKEYGPCEIKSLGIERIIVNSKINSNELIKMGYDNIKPIPLTEEWLMKFDKIEWISKDIGGIFYWFNGKKKYLKFVHLLQNTYFCIEQKELLCVNI